MSFDAASMSATAGSLAGYLAVALLCAAGVIVSALTFSGTWLVLLATLLAAWLSGPEFPGWITVAVFALLCAAIEVVEVLAGLWGVQKRGGSKLAGFAALAGGLLGMFVGSFIPVPVLGTLAGMFAGSFGLAYYVERRRLSHDQAAHIATGAVLARIAVLLLKVTATLGMIAALYIGMAIA